MHPLIFIPSARDLPEFEESTNKLPYDKLWVKYFAQEEAYKIGRQWFLEHPEFTHFVILPDDLIVKHEDIQRLLLTDVISGWCVHGKSPADRKGIDSNLGLRLPNNVYNGEYNEYQFLPIKLIESIGESLIPIAFAGFAPTVIPRSIVEKIDFRADHGCCVDTCLAMDLRDKGITQFADLSVKTVELDATNPDLIQVDKKEARVIFESS